MSKLFYTNNTLSRKYKKEREVLAELYSNNAKSIKYLLYFFKNKQDLINFFTMFKGKTLEIPETFEDFLSICLDTNIDKNNIEQTGINNEEHEKIKDKIVQTYLNLYDTDYEKCIKSELKFQKKLRRE